MCGIAGVLYRDPRRPVEQRTLLAMGEAIAHRGPDAAGYFRDAGIGLVHRRLSIIDLAGGDQPIANEDESLQVVFNGEIYNFQSIRHLLESRGHRFKTRSDTEVLVHLYEEHGERLTEHLRGMFAFALWDSRRRKLLLARDHVGQKPLYIYRDAEKLLFASELKAILAHPDVDRSVDLRAIEEFLAYGIVPGPRSIFENVIKLGTGSSLLVDAETLTRAVPRRYWKLEFRPDASRNLQEWKQIFSEKIEETVQSHRIADVPVGAFLSGGLDSSTVVAALAKQGGETLTTFSIGFDDEEFSELPHARAVARQFGTNHVEEVVAPEAANSLDDLVRYYDEPFADSSAIPTMAVSKLAAQHVKVVLSGDGGDEAFGGYARYQQDLREARLRNLMPAGIRKTFLRAIAAAWPNADWLPQPLRWKSALVNLSCPVEAAYARTLSLTRQPARGRLLSHELRHSLGDFRAESVMEAAWPVGVSDPLSGMIGTDLAIMLPDDYLTKVDRASMAYGLEVRPPFVDHELLELAAQLPSGFKVRSGELKWLLKDLMKNQLPPGLAHRRKQGFEIPVDRWMRGPLADRFEETVLAPGHIVSRFIDQDAARLLFEEHRSRRRRHGSTLWSLLVLARWCDEYVAVPSGTRTTELVTL